MPRVKLKPVLFWQRRFFVKSRHIRQKVVAAVTFLGVVVADVMRFFTRSFIIFLTLAIALRLPVFAASQMVTVRQLGSPGDPAVRGDRPTLNFYLPVFRSVRAVRFRATLSVSPAVDPNSTITVSSGGTPQWSTSVENIRKHPVIDIPLPLPQSPSRTVDVSIAGAFAHIGDDICSRYDPSSLYLIVKRGAGFVVDSEPLPSTIAGFLEVYSGDVAIVAPPGSSSERLRTAVQLAYQVQQLYRWRGAGVVLRSSVESNARNVVLGDFKTDLAVRGNVLEVGPTGVDLLERQIDPLLITTAVDFAQVAPVAADATQSQLSLRDLGLTTETAPGDHVVFSSPLNIGRIGGLPQGLRFVAAIAHTALEGDERGTVELTINGALVDSVPLVTKRGRQDIEFPISSNLVASANDVRLAVNYDAKRDCHVGTPTVTTTLYDDAYFRWDSVVRYTLSVGEFFRSAAGRMAVLIEDDRDIPYAFSLLSTIGSGNPNVTSVTVLPFNGTLPKGYDAVIVVASLNRLSGFALPLVSDGQGFKLGKGAPPLSARYQDAFGILETTRVGDAPVLVASYWKDLDATSGLGDLGYATIADQTDRVFMFRGSDALYASTAPRVRDLPQPILLRAALPITAGVVVLFSGVLFLARRKRTGGRAV